jgi:hypothetical protein
MSYIAELPDELVGELDRLGERHGTDRTTLVRRCLMIGLVGARLEDEGRGSLLVRVQGKEDRAVTCWGESDG